jgi:hypothetical protein
MKLRIKNENGMLLMRPSKLHRKLARVDGSLEWGVVRENGDSRELYPREVEVKPGTYAVEQVPNPFIPGGEPWLVLRGSRIGAAESYLRQFAAATRGTANAVEVLCD